MTSAGHPDAAMTDALRARADAHGRLSYRDFTDIALFHPVLGYYRRAVRRVGSSPDTDFRTASSAGGETFGALVADAARAMLGDAVADVAFVEIGAEPGDSIFRNAVADFAALKTIRVGDPFDIPARAVVFANELFDAQPFVRLRFESGAWRELGVVIRAGGELAEIVLPDLSPAARRVAAALPPARDEGWVIDLSPDADDLLDRLVAGLRFGAVIFADYGKTRREMLDAVPHGTARAYSRHAQSSDLLATPGRRDLTHHVAWDSLEARLAVAGFSDLAVERQETFLMRRAARELERRFHDAAFARDTARMGVLRELVHPAHFGGKFQILSGVRR